jgi:hypothetical protein
MSDSRLLFRDEKNSRLRALVEAANDVAKRHFRETLGPCRYCEWPITICYRSVDGQPFETVCTICEHLLDSADATPEQPAIFRIFEHEEPACAI